MIFISYSHQDSGFVNQLAAKLIEARVQIWHDRIEIKVGDSLIDRIQGAISEADFLAIVLSKASVASAWCREELNAGLLRQLEERRVVVLPLVIEDCDLPVFVRQRKYADFRRDFRQGFQELREAIASAAEKSVGRHDTDEYQIDYGMNWSIRDKYVVLEIDGVGFSKRLPYSVLTRIRVTGNDVATRRYKQYADNDLRELGMAWIVAMCEAAFDSPSAHMSLADNEPMTLETGVRDTKTNVQFDLSFWARRVGTATGTSAMYHFGAIFGEIVRELIRNRPVLTADQKSRLESILRGPPT